MSTSSISPGGSQPLMPPQISSSSGLSANSTLTNSGAGGIPQITGLASGIDTTKLIQAELAEKEMPLLNMQNDIASMQNENQALSQFEQSLQNASFDALDLSEPSLFFLKQTVRSSDSNLVSAATTKNVGAVIGSSTVAVAQLAGASQATYNYTAPASSAGDTLSVQVGSGAAETISVAQGETVDTLASDINGSNTLGVWASVTNGQLVLSSRTTGTGNLITVSTTAASGGASTTDLSQVSSQDGQDAEVYVNGSTTAVTSATDTVTNAIAGVTLTLTGVTAANAPVTITTSAPGPDGNSIAAGVKQFVSDYNSAVESIEAAVNTAPASESNPAAAQADPGSLFGDPELENLLDNMRQTIYSSDSTLTSGFQSMQDLGVSTGISTGQATSSGVAGLLTIDSSQLQQAIQQNPDAVQQDLASWASKFQSIVNAASGPGGALSTRMDGNNTLISSMQSQLASQTSLYNQQEANMEEQWAQVEATLESLNNQKTTLSSFASSLSANTTNS